MAEADGVLQMLRWLGRTPESFVPDFPDPDAACFHLPALNMGQTLRWDTQAIYSHLDSRRQSLGLAWKEVAGQIGAVTPGMLTNLGKGGRTSFPAVMRIVRWLAQPAAAFTRIADR